MAQPTPYVRSYSFTDFQVSNPTTPLPGNQVDSQLNELEQTLSEILVNLALIQRDDGNIANQTVGIDQLKPEVQIGINNITDWVTGHVYTTQDAVWELGILYRCVVNHTSGVFATDLSGGKWLLILNAVADLQPYIDELTATSTAALAVIAADTVICQNAAIATAANVVTCNNSVLSILADVVTCTNAVTSTTASAAAAATSATNAAVSAATAVAAAAATNIVSQGADPTGVVEAASYFQAAHDAIYNAAVTAGNTNPSGVVIMPSGKYKISSQLVWRPWIKLVSNGPVWLDFSGLSTSTSAFRSHAESGPAAAVGKNSANTGPWLNGTQGAIYVAGPGTGGTSIGLDVGNSSHDSSGLHAYRDVSIDSVVVSSFHTLMNIRSYDTYLMTVRNCRLETCVIDVAVNGVAANNSGERMGFINTTFAGASGSGGVGFDITSAGFDFNFDNCSFDFCHDSAIRFNSGAGYNKLSFSKCHFESSNNVALIQSNLAAYNNIYIDLKGCKFVPTNNNTVPVGSYSDNTSSPFQSMFTGRMSISFNDFLVGGYSHPSYAAAGLFLCDTLVVIKGKPVVNFNDFRQCISASKVMNYNWDFNLGSNGTALDYSAIPGFHYVDSSGITAALSNTIAYNSSALSLAFTETASPGSNYYLFATDPFLVDRENALTQQNVMYGGTSTGTIACQSSFIRYREGFTLPADIVSVTRSGNTATFTTLTAHNLSVNHVVFMKGWTQAAYNGKLHVVTTPSSTTFTCRVNPSGSPTTPGTGTPTYQVEPLIPISADSNGGDSFGTTIYGATGDPAYTGDRLWWAKQGILKGGLTSSTTVAGQTHGRFIVTVSALAASDVVYMGACIAENT